MEPCSLLRWAKEACIMVHSGGFVPNGPLGLSCGDVFLCLQGLYGSLRCVSGLI